MENHEYEQHEQHDASPEEMMAALLSANRELTSCVESLTRRLTESGNKVEDDRPMADQTPSEAVAIFQEAVNSGKPRVSAIALAVADRMSRQRNREERKEKALIQFGSEFERAEKVKRLERELAAAKEQAHGVEIPEDEPA